VRYHEPGTKPLKLEGAESLRVFVLGPPKDEKLIRKSSPTKSGHEVYELTSRLALLANDSDSPDSEEFETPRFHAFEPRYRIPSEKAAHMSFFRGHSFHRTQRWRTINNDMAGAAEELALALDNHTNNTSLVLAFELEPRGRVLLFPGDAQVGNWLSWDAYRWKGESAGETVSAAGLLERTVVYKVGHHASHNATLREKGLERMTSGDLVALVPVDREMAKKKRWNMPFPSLLERLQELSRGRVLRADEGVPRQPESVTDARWKEFLKRTNADPGGLYHDYVC
jgi:hypothetical protein